MGEPVGTTWSIARSVGWSLVYAVVLYMIIVAITMLGVWGIGAGLKKDGSAQDAEDVIGNVVGKMMWIYIIVISLSVAGGLGIMYKSLKNPYWYGWSDAEAHHKIADEKRMCKEYGSCLDLP